MKPFSARELVARVEAQLVRAKMRSLEEAQAVRLASVFAHAPVGVAILGAPRTCSSSPTARTSIDGRHAPVVGQAIREALPELEGQGIYELLDGVYSPGEPFVGRSVRVMIDRGAQRHPRRRSSISSISRSFDDAAR